MCQSDVDKLIKLAVDAKLHLMCYYSAGKREEQRIRQVLEAYIDCIELLSGEPRNKIFININHRANMKMHGEQDRH